MFISETVFISLTCFKCFLDFGGYFLTGYFSFKNGYIWGFGLEFLDSVRDGDHIRELPGNYPVLTAVMVICNHVERIWRIIVTPNFCITYMIMEGFIQMN